ncbi:MAG: PAS domain S-box protein, partial [Desulfobacterales bacterium]|nr:PAS domain S-box protein [Desulfobacterales bacterium]
MNVAKNTAFSLENIKRNRRLPAMLAIFAGVLLSVTAFAAVQGWEERKIRTDLEYAAKIRTRVIREMLEKNLLILEATRGFMSGSKGVTRTEFMDFATPLIRQSASIKALGWAPRASADQGGESGAVTGARGLEDFRITGEEGAGGDGPGARGADHFPIRFLEPFEAAGSFPALDPASAAERRKAMERSRDSGEAVLTARENVRGKEGIESRFLIFSPVYEKSAPLETPGERRGNPRGLVLVFFGISDFLERSPAFLKHPDILVQIYDESAPENNRLIYDGSRISGENARTPGGVSRVTWVERAGRKWTVRCTPTPAFVAGRGRLHPLGVMISGLMATGLLAMYLLAGANRAARIDQLLENQTALNEELVAENTERKRVQAELQKHRDHLEDLVNARARELKASEEKFRKIADYAYDWEFWTSPEGSFNYVSPSCKRISGYEPDAFMENPGLLNDIIHPEDREVFSEHRKQIHQQGKSDSLVFRLITSNGRTIWIEHQCRAVYGPGGQYLGRRGANRDITEKKEAEEALHFAMEQRAQAEEQLKILVKDLERANNELQDFAYVVSHDLKAPLRGISSLTQWLSDDYEDVLDDAGREYLDKLLVRTRRMYGFIEGILQYSRAGRVEANPERLDAGEVVREVIDDLSPPDNITVSINGVLPEVVYDRMLLGQLFQNLISNAVKHLDKPSGEVTVSCADLGDAHSFCVRDNGVGIEK